MVIGSDLWVLFTNLQREFGFKQIAEIQFTDGNRTIVMHANYYLMCETQLTDKGLNLDDCILDDELLHVTLFECEYS